MSAAAGGHFEEWRDHHVVFDEPTCSVDGFFGEFEAVEDFFGDVCAVFGVAIVADTFFVDRKCVVFADVVEESCPFEGEGWGLGWKWVGIGFFVGEGVDGF